MIYEENRKYMKNNALFWFLFTPLFLIGCTPTTHQSGVHMAGREQSERDFQHLVEMMVKGFSPGETVAVAPLPEMRFGDLSALGSLWRTRLERSLKRAGARVKVRQEVAALLTEAEMFAGRELDWEAFGADILVTGSYRLQEKPSLFSMQVKATRLRSGELLGSFSWQQQPEAEFGRLSLLLHGNIKGEEQADSELEDMQGPLLKARLDRDVACYPSAGQVKILVESEPGVYLYLLNLAADGSVLLLYPNLLTGEKVLLHREFVFPPVGMEETLQLVVGPLQGESSSREAFKVVASREKLDLSFLPVPYNQVHVGSAGAMAKDMGEDARRLAKSLQTAGGWSEVLLSYTVGALCGD